MDNLKNPESQAKADLPSVLVRGAHIWTNNGIFKGSILLENGRIWKIARRIPESADLTIKAQGLIALPGLIDAHAHLRDMRLSYKEDFNTGTAAAAAGGFTTVLDMPNTHPPTTSDRRLLEKARRASRKILVNVGFHVAAVGDRGLARAMKKVGAFSMKLYLPNPISPLEVKDDRAIVQVLRAAKQASLPLTVHAENAEQFYEASLSRTFKELVRSRGERAEKSAVSRILRLQQRIGCRVHFCHITLPTSIAAIYNARSDKLSSEVTPHHVLLSVNAVKTLQWKAWMVPPLRPQQARAALYRAMAAGKVTLIATDHAPHTVEEKQRQPTKSPPGIPGLETALPLMLTMVNKRKLSLARLIALLSSNPARIFGLNSKGKLEKGADADLILVDLKRKDKIRPDHFRSKAQYSPFEGWKTQGSVHTTIVNGRVIYSDNEIIGKPGTGKVLKPARAE